MVDHIIRIKKTLCMSSTESKKSLIAGEFMGIVDTIEDLEKAKSKLDDLKIESESNEKWDLAEALEEYIKDIQSVIDALSDDTPFISKQVEDNIKGE